jgi:hypothetical protein
VLIAIVCCCILGSNCDVGLLLLPTFGLFVLIAIVCCCILGSNCDVGLLLLPTFGLFVLMPLYVLHFGFKLQTVLLGYTVGHNTVAPCCPPVAVSADCLCMLLHLWYVALHLCCCMARGAMTGTSHGAAWCPEGVQPPPM